MIVVNENLNARKTHREIMTQIFELFLQENLKHFESVSLNCLEVSKWTDIVLLGEGKNYRNICHAIDAVKFTSNSTSGENESTTYTKKFTK